MSLQPQTTRIHCPVCKWSHVPSTGPLHTGVYQAQCRRCGYSFNFKSTTLPRQSVSFTINGIAYDVSEEDSQMVLHNFLTSRAGLRQAKFTCFQGSCSSCLVTATFHDPALGKEKTIAVQSCLRPVYACDGWDITTTEGLGNKQDGYHTIQQTLAENSGSQCGWCSPGMVMSMYSYMKDNPSPKAEEIEGLFDGNLCRCTGYRPILQAFRTFAEDANSCRDIEDLAVSEKKICKKTGTACNGGCHGGSVRDPIHVILKNADWYAPSALQELYDIIKSNPGKKIHLVMGNTASAVYRDQYDLSVDIKGVTELYTATVTENELTLGSNVTLSNMMTLLTQASSYSGFEYCADVVEHLRKVANTPVRNVGTWAGNLVLKKKHREFRSDVYVILETIGATIIVGNASTGQEDPHTPASLLETDLDGKVILRVQLPKVTSSDYIHTYKVMPRSQTAYAYTNMGISLKMDAANNYTVSGSPVIAFNGISSTVYRATATENYLVGKAIGTNAGLQGALQALENELKTITANLDPLLPGEDYRKSLITALFYRFMLKAVGDSAGSRFKSGATEIERPLSTGTQDFSSDSTLYPMTEPMPKISAIQQASGEAEYINGIPEPPGTLFGQFVLATQANCTIESVDPSTALAYPGVKRFISAADILGINNFFPVFKNTPEELFCSGEVLYAGQAIGLILAESQGAAIVASNLVKVTYTNVKPPILTIKDAIAAGSFFAAGKPPDLVIGDAEGAISNSPHVIEGEFCLPDQYHLHMENQIALVVPNETGLDVYASTQWPDMVQQSVAAVTNTSQNTVNVMVRRLGGAYGAKITRNLPVAAGCGLAAKLMNRPVKVAMTLGANMQMLGKRFAYYTKYKVGVNNDGKLNGVIIEYYGDGGCQQNDSALGGVLIWADNAYKCDNWHLSGELCKTHKPAGTWCRSPGSFQSIGITEYIMEHVSKQLGKDSLDVKKLNLYKKDDVSITGTPLPYCNIDMLVQQLETTAEIPKRKAEVNTFNQNNRWKKRGLGVMPLKFGISLAGFPYTILVNIYNGDGSVSIQHGGIEIGQGIHTMTMQVLAHKLGIPLAKVTVTPTDTKTTANSQSTGGSITSEICCYGVDQCCEILLSRINPVRETMPPNSTWEEVIAKCYSQGIDLSARYWSIPGSSQEYPWQYFCYGSACAEVELDVLTGHRQVNRVDILYDAGRSINPEIDVGQIEGAFVMGMGNYLQEQCIFDKDTGRLLTNSTESYYAPMSKDIPVDFRVALLRNAYNPLGVLGVKAVAEPPQCMTIAVFIALKNAVEAARTDAQTTGFFPMDAPGTVDATQMLCLNSIAQYQLV